MDATGGLVGQNSRLMLHPGGQSAQPSRPCLSACHAGASAELLLRLFLGSIGCMHIQTRVQALTRAHTHTHIHTQHTAHAYKVASSHTHINTHRWSAVLPAWQCVARLLP
eukprot:1142194-Pelagomonas_calceolata.AAC.4